MDTNKIREAGNKMRDALRQYIGDGVGGPHVEALSSWSKAIAELDKAQQPGKVLTNEEAARVTEYVYRNGLDGVPKHEIAMAKAGFNYGLRYARDNGYIAPTAGLTVEEIDNELAPVFQAIDWGQTDRAYKLLSGARHRLTAAINAKNQ